MFITSSSSVPVMTTPGGVSKGDASLPLNTPAAQSNSTTATIVKAAMTAMTTVFLLTPPCLAGLSGRSRAARPAPASSRGAPHLGQKAAPGLSCMPHFAQKPPVSGSGGAGSSYLVPHSQQNSSSS